ncbi:hypothetical protein GCM10027569_86540 [Flindersiella endophytica]
MGREALRNLGACGQPRGDPRSLRPRRSELRLKQLRTLSRFTPDDDREYQTGYGRCSTWARRHDKDPEFNYVPRDVREMEQALEDIKTWYNRIRTYKN